MTEFDEDDDFGKCVCGSAWFELITPPDAEGTDVGPAVCVDREGNITGYAAALQCVECRLEWYPARQPPRHLRLVL